jgi:hypothetical protein
MGGPEPRRGRQVPVAFVEPPPVDLRQPSHALQLDQLGRLLQLREVLLDPRVRKLRERLDPVALDRRQELAHDPNPSNMCSRLEEDRT